MAAFSFFFLFFSYFSYTMCVQRVRAIQLPMCTLCIRIMLYSILLALSRDLYWFSVLYTLRTPLSAHRCLIIFLFFLFFYVIAYQCWSRLHSRCWFFCIFTRTLTHTCNAHSTILLFFSSSFPFLHVTIYVYRYNNARLHFQHVIDG